MIDLDIPPRLRWGGYPRARLVRRYCEALGLTDLKLWPEVEAVAGIDPVTRSQFLARLTDSLETTRERLAERRWEFQR
jgi:hypothetical protein